MAGNNRPENNNPVLYMGKFKVPAILYYKGYTYHKDASSEKSKTDYIIYRCTERIVGCCSAVLKLKKGTLEIYVAPDEETRKLDRRRRAHSCGNPDFDYPDERNFRDELCRRAHASFKGLFQIYNDTAAEKE